MSFHSEKKKEHGRLAIQAVSDSNYTDAFFHLVKEAEYGLCLAESCEGAVSKAYLNDAKDILALAKEVKQKALAVGKTIDGHTKSELESDSKASQWLLKEKPTIKLDDVAGLDDVKKIIEEDVLNAMKYSEAYRTCKIPPGGGALMYGPPGNGKTFIAKAIAGELDAAFFTASGAQIKSKYVGEAEKNMRLLFEEAAKSERAVIFLDEIHSLLGRRGNEKTNLVDEFLVLADGIQERKNNLLILGATNYPWLLDQATFRRLQKMIYVGLPDQAAREKIFTLQFEGTPISENIDFNQFAEQTEGYSGADVARICTAAKKNAIRNMIASKAEKPIITAENIATAIQETSPTTNLEQITKYQEWRDSFATGHSLDD